MDSQQPMPLKAQRRSCFEGLRVCVVSPFLPRPGGVSVQAELLCQFLEEEGAGVRRVDTNVQVIRRLPVIGRILLPFVQVPAVALRLLVNVPRSDLIHVQAASFWAFFLPVGLAWLAGRLFGRPVVVSFFGGKASFFLARWHRWVVPLFQRVDGYTVSSQFLQRVFRRYGLNPQVIPSVIDLERYPFRPRAEWPPLILWMRGLLPNANPGMALRAFALVREEIPDARLLMVGQGPLAGMIRGLARELGVAQAVSYKPWLPEARLREVLQTASVLWNTTSYDNFPLSLLEAAASGAVVVSTDVGGISELLENGVDGLLVAPDDHEALAAATIQVLRRPALADSLARNAREAALRFSWPGIRAAVAALYGVEAGPSPQPGLDEGEEEESPIVLPGGMVARTEYLLSEQMSEAEAEETAAEIAE